MKIHREGYSSILFSLVFLGVLNAILFVNGSCLIDFIILSLSFLVFLWIILFFRNPERLIPPVDERTVLSPADGTVVDIQTIPEQEYFQGDMIRISIFMSLFNVHLNRVPFSGKVVYQKYHPGKNFMAFHEKSSVLNEHNTVVIEGAGQRKLLVRQIAGFLARRIKPYIHQGQEISAGQELGFIRFGSRVDIFLPVNSNLAVKINQKVKGNISVIAFFS